jgi:hypothetical protein
MSLDPFLGDAVFSPEIMMMLASAFESAWDSVKVSGSPLGADGNAAATREILAKHIIEMARRGERNPKRLVEDAIAHLNASQ